MKLEIKRYHSFPLNENRRLPSSISNCSNITAYFLPRPKLRCALDKDRISFNLLQSLVMNKPSAKKALSALADIVGTYFKSY